MKILLITILGLFAPLLLASEDEIDFRLHLGERVFDPLQQTPFPDGPWEQAQTAEADLQLVQMTGPISKAMRQHLQDSGLTIVQYLHPYTYVVWGLPTQLARLDGDFIRWSGAFLPAYRVLPDIRSLSGAPKELRLLAYRGIPDSVMHGRLQAAGATNIRSAMVDHRFVAYSFVLPTLQLASLARLPGVYTVQQLTQNASDRGELGCQFLANNLVGGLAVPGYESWLTDVGLSGEGLILAVVDSGTDQDHPDLLGAFLPCTGSSCGEDSNTSHGTHTAGIAAGRASSGITDGGGFLRALGVAPAASMIEQVYPATILLPDGMLLLMSESYRNGALLSTNSWGPNSARLGYDIDTMLVDIGVRDVEPQESGNQSFSYVLAIANGDGGVSSQGTPDEAKNIIRVGASLLQNLDGTQQSDTGNLSNTSAHGPASDGRYLPDLVAPGKYVDSSVLSNGYQLRSGTSMATPAVAGGALLFYEYYRGLPHNPGHFNPSPAMVKAALITPSWDLAGGLDADGVALGHRFDSKQGWGRFNLEAVLDPAEPVAYIDNPVVLTASGESWFEDVFVANNSLPVMIMMVYTDAPGHGLGGSQPAWNNDLDLVVSYDGETYRGNQFGAAGWSVTGGSGDGMHNVEAVFLGPTAPTTNLHISVQASNLNSDAIPGSGGDTDQDFAVVCYNCVQETNYLLVAEQTQKVICAGQDVTYMLNVGSIGGFNSAVTLSLSGLPMGVDAVFSNNPLTPPMATSLTISNTAALVSGSYPLVVNGNGGAIDQTLDLVLRVEQTVPDPVALSAPLNGSINQSQSPLFRWQAQDGVLDYTFELASDIAFANILQTKTQTALEYNATVKLDYLTTYYWRVRATNPCGIGDWSATSNFEVLAGPFILLVDDDNNLPNVRDFYTEVLSFYGITYDLWDVSIEQGEPDAMLLAQYQAVIWFSGDSFNQVSTGPPLAGPGEAGEAALSTYLDGGGKLFLSAQHYLLDRGESPFTPTPFMTNYLGLGDVTLNALNQTVLGQGAFAFLGPWSLSAAYTIRADVANPGMDSETVFIYPDGGDASAALMKDNGTYLAIFLPWPFDGLSEAQRLVMMDRLLDVLNLDTGPCANEDDLLAKLSFWPVEENLLSLSNCVNSFLIPKIRR